MGFPEGKILEIDTVSQNRLNSINEISHRFQKLIIGP